MNNLNHPERDFQKLTAMAQLAFNNHLVTSIINDSYISKTFQATIMPSPLMRCPLVGAVSPCALVCQ